MMRLFIIILSWFVGYTFTLAAVARDMKDGDAKDNKTYAQCILTFIWAWPVIGCAVLADQIGRRYRKNESK